MAVSYRELSEASSRVRYWEDRLYDAMERKAQADADICIAEREIHNAKTKVERIAKEITEGVG